MNTIKRKTTAYKEEGIKEDVLHVVDSKLNKMTSIIDVEVLPNGWKGTPVTKDTKRVYFNTYLTPSEVESLYNKVGEHYIAHDSNDDYCIYFYKTNGGVAIDVNFGSPAYKNSEWLMEYTDINYEIFEVSEYNVLLSSLFSSTPFEPTFNTNSIYRLPDGTLWMYQNGWGELVTKQPLTIIDVSTITETNPEDNSELYLDLSQNGEYILLNGNVKKKLRIAFGKCKGIDIGKFLTISLPDGRPITDLLASYSSGFFEVGCYIVLTSESAGYGYYFKVTDNNVIGFQTREY